MPFPWDNKIHTHTCTLLKNSVQYMSAGCIIHAKMLHYSMTVIFTPVHIEQNQFILWIEVKKGIMAGKDN